MASNLDEVETHLKARTLDAVEISLSLYVGLEYEPTFDENLHNLKKNNAIIVSVGEVASIFCRSLYLTKAYDKVASIMLKIREERNPVAEIFYDKSSRILVVICDLKCDENAIPVVLSVFTFFFSQHISLTTNKCCVILTSQYIKCYMQSMECSEQDEPVLKTYATSKYMNTYPTVVIDRPYIPDVFIQNNENVSAGDVLLGMCDKIGIAAILYVCYARYSDSSAVQLLESARNNPFLSQVQTNTKGDYENAYKKELELLRCKNFNF